MSEITKIKVLDGGKGKAVNPHSFSDQLDAPKLQMQKEWNAFDKANPAYDIIDPLSVKVGETVSGTLVWQRSWNRGKTWNITDGDMPSLNSETRLAWQLTPEKEGEEKPKTDRERINSKVAEIKSKLKKQGDLLTEAKQALDSYRENKAVVASHDVDEDISLADEYVLICNFMEYKILAHSIAWITTNCKFKSSWDELMPVVEKIESLGISVEIWKNKVHLKGFYYYNANSSAHYDEYVDTELSKIGATYKAVVEFIKWYNIKSK